MRTIKNIAQWLLIGLFISFPTHGFGGVVAPACAYACGTWLTTCNGGCMLFTVWYPVCAAGCYATSLACVAGCSVSCFSSNTKVYVKRGDSVETVSIADVRIGDIVLSRINGIEKWTRVLKNKQSIGSYDGIIITASHFDSTQELQINVTPEHIMIIQRDSSTLLAVRADHLVVGDKVQDRDGKLLTITNLASNKINTINTLETIDGSVIASDIFTSTICNDMLNKDEQDWESTISDWIIQHKDIHELEDVINDNL